MSHNLSQLKPELDTNNVRMIGVGLEELGLEEFQQGKYWNGELYIDTQKKCYQDLGFKRLGFFGAMGSVLAKKGRGLMADAKSKGIGGNLKGDGMQTGGTLVVAAGGKVLFSYSQDAPGDHAALQDILNALNISASADPAEEATADI